MAAAQVPEFGYSSAAPRHTAAYLRPAVMDLLPRPTAGKRLLDLGCGNGYWVGEMSQLGMTCVGIDPSIEGITVGRKAFPKARFECMVVPDDVCGTLGEAPFDVVVSTEVVEHLYDPRQWAKAAFKSLNPGGVLICSTPYHGYFKNLVLAATGKFDRHFTALWDGGHIKFWSRKTLGALLEEAGFRNIQFRGAGRAPYLWMSMVLSGTKP